ncbi:MAG: hypothetical protein GX790_00040 [Syntrophomonadaceae bacterium]|nr:hypothetical protein [Syntrophomonadaceae bacterium]
MKKFMRLGICLLVCICFITYITDNASAATVNANSSWTHSAWSADYGAKSFVYQVTYIADTTSGYELGSSYDGVSNHDYIAYKSYAIYPPEVGNGEASVIKVAIVNASNNSEVTSLSNSLWRKGTIRGHILPGGSIIFDQLYSTALIQAFPSSNYKVKVVSGFALDYIWTPNMWTNDTCYTSSF